MLRTALNYPTDGEQGSTALVVGSVLTLVLAGAEGALLLFGPLLFNEAALINLGVAPRTVRNAVVAALVVALLVRGLLRGYTVGVLRAVLDGEGPPSFFGRWLLRDALVSAVILVAALLPAGAFIGVSLNVSLVGTDAPMTAVSGLTLLLGVAGVFAAAYLVPAMTAVYAAEGLRRAFAIQYVVGLSLTEDYVVAWLEAVLVRLVLVPVAFALQLLLVGVLLRFHLKVATSALYGTGVRDARRLRKGAYAPAPRQGLPEHRPGRADLGSDTRADDPSAAEFRRR